MAKPKQVAGVRYLINKSRDGNDLTKRILFFLINHSKGLTEEVSLTLTQNKQGFSGKEITEAAHGLDAMCSCGGDTHLDAIMAATGAGFTFSFHYGNRKPDGKFDSNGQFTGGEPTRYTFWLSRKLYDHTAKVRQLHVSRKKLQAIDLSKPGLYPSLEKTQ